MNTPNELQRYMPYSSCAGQRGYMEKEDAGQWVRFSDIEPLIRSHEALREAIKQRHAKLSGSMPDPICYPSLSERVHAKLEEFEILMSMDFSPSALAAAKEVAQPTRAARE